MDSIQALLEALKQHEGKGGMSDDDMGQPIAAKLSVVKAKPLPGNGTTGDGADLSDLSDHGLGHDLDPLPSDLNDMVTGNEDDDDSEGDAQQNAQIVDALQDQYPQIYDKIMKSLDAGQGDDDQNFEDGGEVQDDDEGSDAWNQRNSDQLNRQYDADDDKITSALNRGRTSGSLGSNRYFKNLQRVQ